MPEKLITMPEVKTTLPYLVYSTSGNTTALINVQDNFKKYLDDIRKRQLIGRTLMQENPTIEQVAFVSREPKTINMVMANDELCGGAIVAAGFDILQGTTGTAKVRTFIEGVEKPVKVSISKSGQTWVELPITNKPNMILKTEFGVKIDLGGIIHVVVKTDEPRFSSISAKEKALAVLKSCGMENQTTTAMGVMFVRQNANGLDMQPVVLVPGVSLNLEQSCSTGAIAVALSEQNDQIKPKILKIMQPSGETLSTFIVRSSNQYKTFISGKVSQVY